MKTHKWADVKAAKLSPEQLARVAREVKNDLLDLELRELRELAGKTQVETAASADMSQGEVSNFERREDHLLSSLRRYVEALGGELEVVAVLGDHRIRLRSV